MLGKRKAKGRKSVGHFDTLISSRTSILGDVVFSGGLHIDGRIKGTVKAEENSDAVLRISEVGDVEGDVIAPHVIINGTVHGDVHASENLELAEKAAINGNVYYNLIEMAMGAQVNGNLVHQKAPTGLLQYTAPQSDSSNEEPAVTKQSVGESAEG